MVSHEINTCMHTNSVTTLSEYTTWYETGCCIFIRECNGKLHVHVKAPNVGQLDSITEV